jgi:hypothetical protein
MGNQRRRGLPSRRPLPACSLTQKDGTGGFQGARPRDTLRRVAWHRSPGATVVKLRTMLRRSWALALVTLGACSENADGARATLGSEEPPPVIDANDRGPESACEPCHPNHVAEWRISPHAYAMKDPVFHAMVRVGQADTGGELGDFCVQCHSPLGTEAGETDVYYDEVARTFAQRTEGLSPAAMSGVSCEVCHSITHVESTANADFVMTHDGVRRGTIRDPAHSPAHESEYSRLHHEARICGTCHQVVNDLGFAVERTHREWVASRFNGSQTCQQCHMEAYQGTAAVGGPPREVHRHTFVGVDVSLLPEDEFPGYDEMRRLVEDLLQRSASLSASFEPETRTLNLRIDNHAGHALPSGATMDREMWVELIVRDEAGALCFESGTLDERGDLRVDYAPHTTAPGTDPQLLLFTQELYRDPSLLDPPEDGDRRRMEFLWEPNTDVSRVVGPGGVVLPSYDLSSLGPGSYTAKLRLLFRSFPPHLLRLLEARGGLDPAVKDRVPTVEMNTVEVAFEIE